MQTRWPKNLEILERCNNSPMHISVLLHESVEALKIKKGGIYVDATLGAGGHSHAMCEVNKGITIVGIDKDTDAINRSKEKLENSPCKFIFKEGSYDQVDELLKEEGIEEVDGILFDLGMSSPQLDISGRGFSFKSDEPLLMTMKADPGEGDLTAYEIVNHFAEESIADIIFGYGEEKRAKRIAKAIVKARETSPIRTTTQLVEIITKSTPRFMFGKKGHPAMRTFQALRIATNNELEELKSSLPKVFRLLKSGGRIVVISFHSLEDRIIKRFFKDLEEKGSAVRITKKPLRPSEEEITSNPRSRSAKLRILEKI